MIRTTCSANDCVAHTLALSQIKGIGAKTFKKLVTHFGSVERVVAAPWQELCQIERVNRSVAQSICALSDQLGEAKQVQQQCIKAGVNIVPYDDPTYPKQFKEIPDPPAVIYQSLSVGNLNAPRRLIGIVGTRQATNYGRAVVEELVTALQPYNVTIVSGLAHGIDGCAHRTALKHDVLTLGVTPGGIDHVYPREHANLAQEMIQQQGGGLISEHPPGIALETHLFPMRNRLISALCEVLIVVEAGKRSGALLTAQLANDYHKEVIAIPGGIGDKYSVGCNNLIQRHLATIYTGIAGLIDLLGWKAEAKQTPPEYAYQAVGSTEARLLASLTEAEGSISLDELVMRTQLSMSVASLTLLELSMKGVVVSRPGNLYQIKQKY